MINARYVLTTSGCVVVDDESVSPFSVRLGEWNIATDIDCIGDTCSDPPQDIPVEEIVVHPRYKGRPKYNDIALLRLATPVVFTKYIRAICLPVTQNLRMENDFHGVRFEVSGWGAPGYNVFGDIKKRVVVTGVDAKNCNWLFRANNEPITTQQICAGGDSGEGTFVVSFL